MLTYLLAYQLDTFRFTADTDCITRRRAHFSYLLSILPRKCFLNPTFLPDRRGVQEATPVPFDRRKDNGRGGDDAEKVSSLLFAAVA